MITIYQKSSKLIKNIVLIIAVSLLFETAALASLTYQMSNPANEKISLMLALTVKEHAKGLSGIQTVDFPNNRGMLFINDSMGNRRFWMPDTYFNLDIIFLDNHLKIVGIEKNVPHHPGFTEPPAIYRTKNYQAQFVLETKAEVSFSKKLKIGDQLKWIGAKSLSEIALKTRQKQ